MVGQKQATASIGMLGLVLGYVLWAILGTGAFVPYTLGGVPQIGNIVLFLLLISLLASSGISVLGSFILTVASVVRKRATSVAGSALWGFFLGSTVLMWGALLLHVFKVVPLHVSVLSCVVVCVIVGYGKYKEKRQSQKYTPASDRRGESKSPVKV